MEMPAYYLDPKEQKLWRMAARWISVHAPDLAGFPDRCAPIMELLAKAGALDLPEYGPLPAIAWPPDDLDNLRRITERSRAAEIRGDHDGFKRELERMND